MRKFLDSVSIEDSCTKIEGLDLRNNPAARTVFIKTAIDYSRAELKKRGIELLALGSYEDLRSFCNHWLSDQTHTDNYNLLIVLAYAIESRACDLASRNRGERTTGQA